MRKQIVVVTHVILRHVTNNDTISKSLIPFGLTPKGIIYLQVRCFVVFFTSTIRNIMFEKTVNCLFYKRLAVLLF